MRKSTVQSILSFFCLEPICCKKQQQKSSWPVTSLKNTGPLKGLNDSKLIVYDSKSSYSKVALLSLRWSVIKLRGFFFTFISKQNKSAYLFLSMQRQTVYKAWILFTKEMKGIIQGRHGWQGPQGLVPRFCVSIRSYKNRPAQIRRGIPVIGKSLKYILKCVTLILSTAQRLSL